MKLASHSVILCTSHNVQYALSCPFRGPRKTKTVARPRHWICVGQTLSQQRARREGLHPLWSKAAVLCVNQLFGSNWGFGVLLRGTSALPGWGFKPVAPREPLALRCKAITIFHMEGLLKQHWADLFIEILGSIAWFFFFLLNLCLSLNRKHL